MGTIESGSRQWPMHGRPPSPASPVRERHEQQPRNSGSKSENPSPRDSLPSIAFLDLRRTGPDTRQREQDPPAMASVAAGSGSTSTPLVSPTSTSHPPPPHHQRHPSDSHSSYKPPESNSACPSPKEREQQPSHSAQPRQSLPSIHEALGNSNPLPYPPPPPPASQHPSAPTTTAPQQNIAPRPTGDAPSGPPNPFSNAPPPTSAPTTTASTYSYHPSQPSQQDNQQSQRLSLISVTSQESGGRSLGSSNRSPTQSSKTGQSSISSGGRSSEPPGQSYTKAMASPTGYGSYGQPLAYQTQPQQQQQQQQQHHPQHVPAGQAPMAYSSGPAPPHYDARPPGPPAPWNGDPAEYGHAEDPQRAGATPRGSAPLVPYSESVKRHLEGYDVEASLNEITEASSRLLDFSRVYAARAHQNNRAGPLVGSLPSVSEIDTLLQLNRRSSDALARIRNTVLTHEHAMAEQRNTQQGRAFNEGAVPGPYQGDHGAAYPQEETKGPGGFAGGNNKKPRPGNRGKAAPPGRCHSCNRAETPEWRRGPDGARTLCNACGLHYAKLTRKMGANKASALGSNFRPRSSVEMRS